MNNKTFILAVASMWFATALAVIVGILITKSASCLWAMFIPALCKVDANCHKVKGI
jgi:hypothetical protein|uniref:Uncharacterized protein n=1 Tax=Siphoviridae sp. cteLh2 TaxID=2825590 RepID=A0A8S5U5W3_9CAUD|nr:hypothetical protein [uncultured Lachnoclostridium sp.]DAF89805.1 MAG TPA: hypothetical protein [Siphoviridae sp. cteLh2]